MSRGLVDKLGRELIDELSRELFGKLSRILDKQRRWPPPPLAPGKGPTT